MKTILILAVLLFASTAHAETWKEQEIREAKERMIQLRTEQIRAENYDKSQGKQTIAQCDEECNLAMSTCFGWCGTGDCITTCTISNAYCVNRCRGN
jgi:hypothetical protein